MRERIFLKKCPDGCGKDEYSLGTYRDFELTQKPFFNGWAIYGEIIEPDELDKLLMQDNTFTNKFFIDTETINHFTLEQCENSITDDIDNHWKHKKEIVKAAKKGLLKVAKSDKP